MTGPPGPVPFVSGAAPIDPERLLWHLRNRDSLGLTVDQACELFDCPPDMARAALAPFPRHTLYCGWSVHLHPEVHARLHVESGVNPVEAVAWEVDLTSYDTTSEAFHTWWTSALQALAITLQGLERRAPSRVFMINMKLTGGWCLLATRYLAELDLLQAHAPPIGHWTAINIPENMNAVPDTFWNEGVPF